MKQFIVLFPFFLFGTTSSTWTGTTDADWTKSTNWTSQAVAPDAKDAVAIFSSTFTNQPEIPTGTTVTVGSIEFNSDIATTIKPETLATSILEFEVSTDSASITSTKPGNSISAKISLSSNLSIDVSKNQTLTLSGGMSSSSKSLTKTNVGTLALEGTNEYSGGTVVTAGSLQANSAPAIGSGKITLASGTFQPTANFIATQEFEISGSSVFDLGKNSLEISKTISGDGPLTQTASALDKYLTLKSVNTYKGGTFIKGGTLSISSDGNLGDSSGGISLDGGTLHVSDSITISSTRALSLSGNSGISLSGSLVTIGGNITGSGTLTITGADRTLHLSGESSYSGSTTVNGAYLEGTTSSLKGAMNVSSGSKVIFNQSFDGTYAGNFIGVADSNLTLKGGGTYTFSGDSSSSLASVTLLGGHLVLTGKLGSSSFTIDAGSSLQGTGTLSSTGVSNSGQISPGIDGQGTLTIDGSVTFGTLRAEVDPLDNGFLKVNGNVNLNNGTLIISPGAPGFYGLTRDYTLLSGTTLSGSFKDPPTITRSQFVPQVSYTSTSVLLTLNNLFPFFDFPFANPNEKAVGENLDALTSQGLLSEDLVLVINSLTNQSDRVVNDALDQMHPAAMGAYAELQMNLGGQLLSTFVRGSSVCRCSEPNRFWVDPFGNWLDVDTKGENLGFDVTTKGVAFGYDRELFGFWTVGLGGAYNVSHVGWSKDRGYAYSKGAYGAFYTDLKLGNFALDGAVYTGKNWYDTMRHIHFTTIDRQATSATSGLDLGGKLNLAYYFGTPTFLLYPYLELNYLYLENGSLTEKGAKSLSLNVGSYSSSTFRGQTGVTLEFSSSNYDDTICISPLLSFGYFVEAPIHRSSFNAHFKDETISFRTHGWDDVWHLLNLRFGLGIRYRRFSLNSHYRADVSPDGGSPYRNQRADFQFIFCF